LLLLFIEAVVVGGKEMDGLPECAREDFLESVEQMLYTRATKGIRPILYMSSLTDFECSTLMLLEEPSEGGSAGKARPVAKGVRFLVVSN
jgi:hypothetical protein